MEYPENVRIVTSFAELLATPFSGEVNALCWVRELPGDFTEVLTALPKPRGITPVEDETLAALHLSEAGQLARTALLQDLTWLREKDLDPCLEIVHGSIPEEDPGPVPTDVCSWHVDSATALADTFLCTYAGPSSQAVPNAHAVRKIDVPQIRNSLLAAYGGPDDADFEEWLADNCYDHHYQVHDTAPIITFGLSHLWRIATKCPGSPVLPCIHRAPTTETPRLLMIS